MKTLLKIGHDFYVLNKQADAAKVLEILSKGNQVEPDFDFKRKERDYRQHYTLDVARPNQLGIEMVSEDQFHLTKAAKEEEEPKPRRRGLLIEATTGEGQ